MTSSSLSLLLSMHGSKSNLGGCPGVPVADPAGTSAHSLCPGQHAGRDLCFVPFWHAEHMIRVSAKSQHHPLPIIELKHSSRLVPSVCMARAAFEAIVMQLAQCEQGISQGNDALRLGGDQNGGSLHLPIPQPWAILSFPLFVTSTHPRRHMWSEEGKRPWVRATAWPGERRHVQLLQKPRGSGSSSSCREFLPTIVSTVALREDG
jgi:hypothetical protein